jgi:DNA mismatch repair protein MutL
MSRIRRLPDTLVNKIAAGEVVERPASAVKELVENALDAGSRRVTVELHEAGTQRMRVTDDGSGMTAEELLLALTRHATSKIASEADLETVGSLGFRGEALPAICAVTRFSLVSCPAGEETGALIRGEGGIIKEQLLVAAPPGTTVTVEDLFFNTPARLKFLKSLRTELALVLRALHGLALSHPGVHLEARHGGRAVLTAPRALTLRDRVGALYGFETAARLLDVDHGGGGLRVSGLVAPPQLARGNRDEMSLIVNGRPVRDTLLLQTVLDAYRPLLPRDQFPVVVLRLDLAPQDLDVNVHPTKAWVRFRSPREVQEALFVAVQSALRTAAVVAAQPGLTTPGNIPGEAAAAAGGGEPREDASEAPVQGRLFREEPAAFGRGRFGEVVGQLHETFVVTADEEEVFFIDQHVAHERVLFERLRAEVAGGPLASQELLFPQPLELARGQSALLETWGAVLDRLGFAVEAFGADAALLRAVPAVLKGEEPRRLVEGLLDDVGAVSGTDASPVLDRVLAFVACRAAIKAPAPLEREEMRRLIGDLSITEAPYFCPHGRPIVSRLSLRDIRRELRRTW